MKAVPTFYSGIEYRSRLEALWAIFFDKIRVPFDYEPERFKLNDGSTYLPDFYLPETYMRDDQGEGVYVEIKHENFDEKEFRHIGDQFDEPMVLFCGSPMQHTWYSDVIGEIRKSGYQYYPAWDSEMRFFWCECGQSKIEFRNKKGRFCPACGSEGGGDLGYYSELAWISLKMF